MVAERTRKELHERDTLDAALGETLPDDSVGSVGGAVGLAPALPRGAELGRFVVLARLGSGAMGVVYAAYDPELDRRVAIKILHRDAQANSPRAAARLVREAQALAKVSHPNVITVYEVETIGARVCVVMEFVDGQTLTAWLTSCQRSWREVVKVFASAGAGLAAAHRAGLVHRDFKPDNVLVGNDGRVRVTDFGLVSVAAGVAPPAAGPVPASDKELVSRSSSGPMSVLLTVENAVVGTPAYMAPEQIERQAADARADQFSFCVALYEALYGVRPFAGNNCMALLSAIVHGELRPVPKDSRVPSWLRTIVVRGLRRDPASRYPALDALLRELERDPHQRRRRAAAVVGIGVVIGLLALLLARSTYDSQELCPRADHRLVGVWDDDVRQTMSGAFLATGRANAQETLSRVVSELDEQSMGWVAAHNDACQANRVRGEQSEHLLDLRMQCLDRWLTEFGALTSLLSDEPDATVLNRAVEAVQSLPALSSCSDVERLTSAISVPSDPRTRTRVEGLQRRLSEVSVLGRAGKYPEALPLAKALVQETRQSSYPPIHSQALYSLGTLQALSADPAEAEATLRDALQVAATARDHSLVADVWVQLVAVVGDLQARHDDALAMRTAAEAAVAQAGGNELQLATLYSSFGLVLASQRDFPRSQEFHDKALEIRERLLGRDHQSTAMTCTNLGTVHAKQAHYPVAMEYYERALVAQRKVLGPSHPAVAMTLNNVGNVFGYLGQHADAELAYNQALAIWQESLIADHPFLARCLNNLGSEAEAQGKLSAAQDYYERALEMLQRRFGTSHPVVGMVMANLGEVYVAREQYAEALKLCGEALEIIERGVGADGPDLAFPLTCMGAAQLGAGSPQDAVSTLERAVELGGSAAGEPTDLAESEFLLARALWVVGRERPRALALARRSEQTYRAAGDHHKRALEEVMAAIGAWSAQQPVGAR